MITNNIKISAFISYINIFVNVITGIVLTPLLISQLGQKEYGLYVMIGGVISLIASFDFGLTATISRFVAKHRADNQEHSIIEILNVIQTLFFVIYVISLLSGIYYILKRTDTEIFSLSLIDSNKAIILLSILLSSLPAVMQVSIYSAICNGYENFLFPRILLLIKYVVRTIIIVIVVVHGADSIVIVTVDLVVIIITMFVSGYYVRHMLNISLCLQISSFALIATLTKYSIWMFIYSVVMQFFWQIGQLSIGTSLGIAVVTVYSVGVMLGTYYGTFVTAFSNMFLSQASRLVSKNASGKELLEGCVIIGRVNFCIMSIILGGYYAIGDWFVWLWLGDGVDHHSMWLIGLFIMIAYTVPQSQSFFNNLIEAKGLLKFKSILYLLLMPASIFIARIYFVSYGVVGMVMVMVIFWLFAQFIMNIYFYKILNINIFYFFYRTYLVFGCIAILSALLTIYVRQFIDFSMKNFLYLGLLYIGCFSTLFFYFKIIVRKLPLFLKYKSS